MVVDNIAPPGWASEELYNTKYLTNGLPSSRAIITAADDAADRILYLLDEILQGTNTAERRIAATRVIRYLLDRGAIGAVTTHDLELSSEPRSSRRQRPSTSAKPFEPMRLGRR